MTQPTVLVTTRSFGKEVREPLERLQREGCRILEWREGSGLPESDLLAKLAEADAWIVAFHPDRPRPPGPGAAAARSSPSTVSA